MEKEISLVNKWLEECRVTTRKTINRRFNSYGLKHAAENYVKHYISEPAFIEAMRRAGFKIQPIHNHPSVYFNISSLYSKRLST